MHALGVFRSEAATAVLESALDDPVDDVRWNAALALARQGHSEPRFRFSSRCWTARSCPGARR